MRQGIARFQEGRPPQALAGLLGRAGLELEHPQQQVHLHVERARLRQLLRALARRRHRAGTRERAHLFQRLGGGLGRRCRIGAGD